MDTEIVRTAFSFNYATQNSQQSQLPSNNSKLQELLKKLSKKDMLDFIDKRCEQPNGDPKEYISALFRCLSPEDNQERRVEIMSRVVDLLIKSVLVEKQADEVIRFLKGEVCSYFLH